MRIDLAYRSGQITVIQAHTVYASDEFHYEFGLDPKLKHVPAKGGFDFAMKLTAVALNNIEHFGAQRLDALKKECQRLMDEEVGPDPEFASSQLQRRIDQIRKGNKKQPPG